MDLKHSVKIVLSIAVIASIFFIEISQPAPNISASETDSQSSCPSGCVCMSDAEAEKEGLELCDGQWITCQLPSEPGAPSQYGHCYEKQECPEGCKCMTKDEYNDYQLCDGTITYCTTDSGAKGLCYEPYEEIECPDNCVCMIDEEAKEAGLKLCGGQYITCQLSAEPGAATQYGHCYEKAEEQKACEQEDIDLRQVHLITGEIKFIADATCTLNSIEMLVDGEKVKECTGGYCEYTGGPFKETPAFSVNIYDNLDNLIISSAHTPVETSAGLEDIPQPIEYEPCPFCPEPEEEWGECIGQECEGPDFPQVYEQWSQVSINTCEYENYTLGGQTINMGEGMIIHTEATEPLFNECLNDRDIVLYWCKNGVKVASYTYTCPYGCDSSLGRCICADSDNGIHFDEYGGVLNGSTLMPQYTDFCINNNTLREYYTEINYENNECIIKSVDYQCPGICRDGACHGTCSDGVQNEGEEGIDCGGPCLAACEYDFGWYAQNYGFGFENPAGQNLSYGKCWSTASTCGKGYGNYKDTFSNCEVCICHCFGSCCGWHIHAGLYYPIYRYLGASEGQCTGMSLSSLKFYYGDEDIQDYNAQATKVKYLTKSGSLEDHIAARQGKVLSGENIDHYLFHYTYWGANRVLTKVENALNSNPPNYGMIYIIEDNGWGGWGGGVRQVPSAHTVVATNVEHISGTIARIYLYDSNVSVDTSPTAVSPYFDKNNSPYIEINKQTNKYTYIDNPSDPPTDNEGEPWSNTNDEDFDRIGYMPYSKLGGDVDIPWEWDLLLIGIVGALGSADAQVVDEDGGILGFSENGTDVPTIENAMILPTFGAPDIETPSVFALPMGNYEVNIRGVNDGTYSAHILGDSPDAFAIKDVTVTADTRDKISIHYGAQDTAALSFETSDLHKEYSLEIATVNDDTNDEVLFRIMNSSISSGSRAIFSFDAGSHSLIYTNHGIEPITYSLQIYSAQHQTENISMNEESIGGGIGVGVLTQFKTEGIDEANEESEEENLEDIINSAQITPIYDFTINPMETHVIAPEDWTNLKESEISVKVEKCGDNICGDNENHNSCPEDCPSGEKDNYCDGIEDGKCDPDCEKAEDPDCEAPSADITWPLVGVVIAVVVAGLAVNSIMRRRRD